MHTFLLALLALLLFLPQSPCAHGRSPSPQEPRLAPAQAPATSTSAPLPPLLHDCNGNGVEDAVDIALGTSGDINANAIPDECEEGLPSTPRADSQPRVR